MEELIKKILKEYTEKSLEELMPTYHYEKNINVRFKGATEYTVRKYTKTNDRISTRDVGTYVLSKREKSEAEANIMEVMNVDVPIDLHLGIVVYKVDINTERINYFSKDDKYETLRDTLKDDNPANLYLMDPETQSVGDILFFIVKENKVVTTFWERSFNLESVKEKRNLDVVITADQIHDYAVKKKDDSFDFDKWRRQ
jgi:hypothetical protein